MTEIIIRNFFRLLRAGAFGEPHEEIEPMSAWKWRRLYQFSLMHGVSALLYDGICACSDQFFLQLPDTLLQDWQKSTQDISEANARAMQCASELAELFGTMQLRPVLIGPQAMAHVYVPPYHHPTGPVDIYFPFDTQGRKADNWARENGSHISESQRHVLEYTWHGQPVAHHHRICHVTNSLLSRRIQNITEKELREHPPVRLTVNGKAAETLSPTHTLLLLLLRTARHTLNNTLLISMLTDIGLLLRKDGDRVDFVKLQEWTDRLGMQRMAQLTGSLLTANMGFSAGEIPFMQEDRTVDTASITSELFTPRAFSRDEWFFQQGKGIFVHTTDTPAMMRQTRHAMSHIRLYPTEGITNMLSNLARSLSHIEE